MTFDKTEQPAARICCLLKFDLKNIMKTIILLLAYTQIICSNNHNEKVNDSLYLKFMTDVEIIRKKHFLEINKEAFQEFVIGFSNCIESKKIKKINVASIIDFSKSSNEKRIYILDLNEMKIVHKSLVAHGRNSGNEFANLFSNEDGSKMSCPGFLVTMKPYSGKHGYSLKLEGLESNINDNSSKRAIVIHGADYVSEEFIKKYGRLGRSWGCPALPLFKNRKIIDAVKGGSLIYIYSIKKVVNLKSNLRIVRKKTIETFYSLFGDSV